MRLQLELKVPAEYRRQVFSEILRDIERQVNEFVEGRVAAVTNASTAAPTTGLHNKGDFVRNSTPSEAGAGGSKYVIVGWICSVAGEPGTWLECRTLTGN